MIKVPDEGRQNHSRLNFVRMKKKEVFPMKGTIRACLPTDQVQ